MSYDGLSIMCVLPSAASVPVLWVLFANPRELGVKEARALAAKRPARVVVWYVGAAVAIELGRFLAEGRWVCWVLPAASLSGFAAFLISFARTHPGILETASDELVRRWKRRFFVGRELAVFCGFAALCAVVRVLFLK